MSSANPQVPQADGRASVLMPASLNEAFTYAAPEPLAPGTLVEAKLAGRILVGVVWDGVAGDFPAAKLKPIARVLDYPPLAQNFRRFIDWVAEFTLAPRGAVLSLCGLAHAVKAVKKPYAAPQFTLTLPTLSSEQQAAADALVALISSPNRGEGGWGPDQAKTVPRPLSVTHARMLRQEMTEAEKIIWQQLRREALGVKFRKQHPIGPYIVDFACLSPPLLIELDGGQHNETSTKIYDDARTMFLQEEGFTLLRFWNHEVMSNLDGVLETVRAALDRAVRPLPNPPPKGEGIKPIVLDGVTGSGKTEVYFHAIAAAIAAGGQVLVLVPEIALTHQWLERFTKTFGAPPAVWHSQQTPVQRAKRWQAVMRGEAPVVVGARSALFLPFKNLALIVVDEEHDLAYKQEDGVLYHARDMAVVRAQLAQIPVVLVSATPSLETLENMREGKYRSLHLPQRFGQASLPEVTLIDMVADAPERGDFLSPRVKQTMLAALANGTQSLLFLNRRGYAPLLLCRACGHRFQCADCSAWLVVHGKGAVSRQSSVVSGMHDLPPTTHTYLGCHHCGHREPMPKPAPPAKPPRKN